MRGTLRAMQYENEEGQGSYMSCYVLINIVTAAYGDCTLNGVPEPVLPVVIPVVATAFVPVAIVELTVTPVVAEAIVMDVGPVVLVRGPPATFDVESKVVALDEP